MTISTTWLLAPVLDRRGHFSPLKATTFAVVVGPFLWLAYLGATGGLTPLPWVFSIYQTGLWALWFMLASLAVTPARVVFGWPELIAVRRMLGLAGLAYSLLHIYVWVGIDRFDVPYMVNEALTRPTVWVAAAATLGLIALGVTSFDEAIRRMGTAAWNRLHYLAYPTIGLAVLHFDMSPGSFDGAPFVMAGMFFWLMAWRVLDRYGRATDPLALAVLGVVITVFSFAFQLTWLALYQGVDPMDTLGYSIDLGIGLPPPWQLLVLGFSTAVLAALFGRRARSRERLVLRPVAAEASHGMSRRPANEAAPT